MTPSLWVRVPPTKQFKGKDWILYTKHIWIEETDPRFLEHSMKGAVLIRCSMITTKTTMFLLNQRFSYQPKYPGGRLFQDNPL